MQQTHKSKFDEILTSRESQFADGKKMRMTKESDWKPNLQLGLNAGSVEDGANEKKFLEADQEVDSVLLLSLSPPDPLSRQSQLHSFNVQREAEKQPEIQFLETGSSNKADLGLSTLDLTMSIKALE